MTNILIWKDKFDQWFKDNWRHNDKAHDISHLQRVWATSQTIMRTTGGNRLVVLAGCYFHDVVNLAKNHPERHLASHYAALEAQQILQETFSDFPADLIPAVMHVVHAHSYSADISAESLEAKIVQDADRLESLGAIGLARVFYTSGALKRALFDSADPFARHRPVNDTQWTLDHFQSKLLLIPDKMQTDAGRRLAKYNIEFMINYMAKLSAELRGELEMIDEEVLQHFMPIIAAN